MIVTRKIYHKQIIMHGNSLFNLYANTTTQGGHYCATKVYENLIAGNVQKLALVNLSINGNPTTTKINNWNTQTLPVIKADDVVVLWEITNDVNVNALSGAQAYANLVTFANLVRGVGAKIVCCTAIPRNNVSDTDQNARNFDCNTLLRSSSGVFDLVVDLNTDTRFDAQSDANDATYYQADKLHLTTAGSDIIASMISTAMINSKIV
jgi:lysophospholipase L1-like esterase